MKILAINSNFLPIRLISKFNCIGKMYCKAAVPFFFSGDTYEEKTWNDWLELSVKDIWPKDQDFIESVTQRIAIPKVVRYVNYSKIPKVSQKLSRKAIYERDNYTCYICGNEFSEGRLSIDHVIPQSRGGKNTWENLQTACKVCNSDKGNKTLTELKIRPKFMHGQPTMSNMMKLKKSITVYQKEWGLFGV